MASSVSATKTLDREYLGIRGRLLELAAALDRIDRNDGSAIAQDLRLAHIRQSIAILMDGKAARAERIQAEFSLPYDPNWRNA